MAERVGRRDRRAPVADTRGGPRPAEGWSSPERRVVRLVPDVARSEDPEPPPDPAADAAGPVGESAPEERVEAFVVRTALGPDGEPLRSRVVHVRSQAEIASVGWAPEETVTFMEDCLRIPRSARGSTVSPDAGPARSTETHAVELDAGAMIGGRTRDIELGVATAGGPSFSYTAELADRPYATGHPDDRAWTPMARLTGSAVAGEPVELRFAAVTLSTGLRRLRLRLTVPPSDHPPPVIEILRRPR